MFHVLFSTDTYSKMVIAKPVNHGFSKIFSSFSWLLLAVQIILIRRKHGCWKSAEVSINKKVSILQSQILINLFSVPTFWREFFQGLQPFILFQSHMGYSSSVCNPHLQTSAQRIQRHCSSALTEGCLSNEDTQMWYGVVWRRGKYTRRHKITLSSFPHLSPYLSHSLCPDLARACKVS